MSMVSTLWSLRIMHILVLLSHPVILVQSHYRVGHHQQVFGVPGGGHALKSLTQAFSPVQPPIVSVAPIIPYHPDKELPGAESHSSYGPGGQHHSNQGHGTSTISKSVYVFSAPNDPSDHVRPQIVKQFPQQKQKHYQVSNVLL